jgi:UDP-N-acetylmuramoyl-tripeptide--D-alanyl-D-alanine ligase
MPKLLIQDCARRLFSGEWGEVCIDSRVVKKGDVFVALPGTQCHGNTFIKDVLAKGAAWVIADAEAKHSRHKQVTAVKKPELYLWKLGEKMGELSHATKVAITGSNGKTTTKDMLACLLDGEKETLKTAGNYNNHLGVPLTLCRLKEKHEVAVVEVGTSAPGEIGNLTELVQPHISVLTSINRAHLSGFKSLTAIAQEKSQIFMAAPEAKCFLRSEDLKHRIVRKAIKNRDAQFFDIDEDQDEAPELIFKKGMIHWNFKGKEYALSSPAKHNINNAQAALMVAKSLGCEENDLKERLKNWKPPAHRMCLVNWKKRKILDDCYNANPASVISALETAVGLKRRENQRIFVALGDMKEMGRRAKALHRDIGVHMAKLGVDFVLTLGEDAREAMLTYAEGGGGNFCHCETPEDMAVHIKTFSRPHDIILVKGSRSMKLENVINALDEDQRQQKVPC